MSAIAYRAFATYCSKLFILYFLSYSQIMGFKQAICKTLRFKPYKFKQFIKVFFDSVMSWFDHRAASKGAALAFYALFSLAPILILTLAVASYFLGSTSVEDQFFYPLQNLVGKNGALAIKAMLASAQDPAEGWWATSIAVVLLIIGATTVFTELKGSLDELWGVPKSELSPMSILLRTRLLSFGLVAVLAFLLLISLVVNSVLSVLEQYFGGIWSSSAFLFTVLSSAISFAVITSLFAVIYKMLPDAPLSWHDVAIGSIVTAGLFTLGKYLIGIYIGNSGVASSFGAAGSVVALLLWIYYSAQIFFFGAEFTRQYAISFGSLKHYKKQQQELDAVVAKPLENINSSGV